MGKGDKKTKRGKIVKGTYGVSRPRKNSNKDRSQAESQEKQTKK